jgi:large subunit ribosomal protein L1
MANTIEAAIDQVKAFEDAKFPERMEAHVRLQPPGKGLARVHSSFLFPCELGWERRVICFAADPAAAESAAGAGAVSVGGEELAQRVQSGWMDFDAIVVHPSAMRWVGRLGKVLGPKGLMPSAQEGSITSRVGAAVSELRTRRVRLREDDGGSLHVVFGLKAMATERLAANLTALLDHLAETIPTRLRKVRIAATMSRSVEVAVPRRE